MITELPIEPDVARPVTVDRSRSGSVPVDRSRSGPVAARTAEARPGHAAVHGQERASGRPSGRRAAPDREVISLGIVDDHQVLLDGLTAWLTARADDVQVMIACRTWPALLAHGRFPVDVVLLDLDLGDGLPPAVKIATLRMSGVATVVIGTCAEPAMVRECLSSGALGYVPKSDDAGVILQAVRAASRGETYLSATVAAALAGCDDRGGVPRLSDQERRVLVLYASGLPMKSVARRLDVGYETAKSYLGRVREKYAECGRDARSKIDLRRRAVEDGLISGR